MSMRMVLEQGQLAQFEAIASPWWQDPLAQVMAGLIAAGFALWGGYWTQRRFRKQDLAERDAERKRDEEKTFRHQALRFNQVVGYIGAVVEHTGNRLGDLVLPELKAEALSLVRMCEYMLETKLIRPYEVTFRSIAVTGIPDDKFFTDNLIEIGEHTEWLTIFFRMKSYMRQAELIAEDRNRLVGRLIEKPILLDDSAIIRHEEIIQRTQALLLSLEYVFDASMHLGQELKKERQGLRDKYHSHGYEDIRISELIYNRYLDEIRLNVRQELNDLGETPRVLHLPNHFLDETPENSSTEAAA